MAKEEKEIKIELNIPFSEFIERITNSGFEKEKEISQRDNYFDTSDWKLYKSVASLRVRQVNNVDHSLTFKKVFHLPERTSNKFYVEEIEGKLPLTDKFGLESIAERLGMDISGDPVNGMDLSELFRMNGFQDEQVLNKVRSIYKDKNNDEIVIDNVDNVGMVIEIECCEGNPIDLAERLLSGDEWKRSTQGTSYIWLENIKGFNDHLGYDKRWTDTPDWNVWENEKDMYGRLLSDG
jgi:adenylate cyclase class IV